ncbi:flavin reductase family protein [Cellvibrio fontiphilus]|uniref:Flavin reductase family protein n=1 Tax=Cellvibrio fontiphilus TaxID=1815559 RepID=A0ABV7FEI7_9GAMM
MHIKVEELEQMEQRKRAQLINSLGGFKSVVMLGTQNVQGQTNLAIFSSFFHLGANPALCGVIVRPDNGERHSLNNIMATELYTINHVHQAIYQQAHQTSASYPALQSEFAATGLTEQWLGNFFAPFVQESRVKMAVQLVQRVDLDINGTILLIGKILEIHLPDNIISHDGFIDLEAAGSLTLSGLDSYHRTQKIARLSYAKPDLPVKILD